MLAHRGASAHERENTIAAFAAAVAGRADGVELDVRPTADGALAVHHDAHLPDGRSIPEVRAADLPEHVPLLEAALEACGSLLVNVEIKHDRREPGFSDDHRLAAPVVVAIRAWGGRAVVSSFDPGMVDAVRAVDGDLPTAQLTALLDRAGPAVAAAIRARGHSGWNPWHPTLDREAIDAGHASGLTILTWTVDDPRRIAELAEWGVDGIVANDPVAALRVLGR